MQVNNVAAILILPKKIGLSVLWSILRDTCEFPCNNTADFHDNRMLTISFLKLSFSPQTF